MSRRTRSLKSGYLRCFLAVHTPARFATLQLNFGVVLARHGFSERRTSPEIMVRCVFGGLYPRSRLARDSQSRYPGVSQPVVIRASLIPPHFSDRHILAVDTFIDIKGQNWFGNTRLCTHLQHKVIQGGLPPRWPQLSQKAWGSEKHNLFHVRKMRFPATLLHLVILFFSARRANVHSPVFSPKHDTLSIKT